MKYKVIGKVEAWVTVTLEADSEEDAIKRAFDECSSVSSFIGNGGYDKVIGVSDTDCAEVSIRCDGDIDYSRAERTE